MNAATETVKRHKLTQEDCDTAKYLMEHRRTLKEIADIIGVDPSTVGKIRLANYDLPTYLEQRKQMNRKTKERKAAAEAGRRRLNALLDPVADEERDQKVLAQLIREEQAAGRYPKLPPDDSWKMEPAAPAEVPGQMKMDLEPEKDSTPAAQDDTKSMMKFQAAMVDKLVKGMTEAIVAMINKLTVLDEIRDALTRRRQ